MSINGSRDALICYLVIYVPVEPSTTTSAKTTSATFGLNRLVVGLKVGFELPNGANPF